MRIGAICFWAILTAVTRFENMIGGYMRFFAAIVALVAMVSFSAAKEEMSVETLVKQHLGSIGTEQARAAVKSRAVEGSLKFTLLDRNSGAQDGKEVFI